MSRSSLGRTKRRLRGRFGDRGGVGSAEIVVSAPTSITDENGAALTATIFVDDRVSSSGDGTTLETAYKTVTEAKAAASPNDVIGGYPGDYRESVTQTVSGTSGNPISIGKLAGVSGDFVIKGSELTTGWTACVNQADAGGNANWANMFKTTIPSSITRNPTDYNLCQGGTQMYMPISVTTGMDTNDKLFHYRVDAEFDTLTTAPDSVSITGATQANPVVLTVTSHPFANGDVINVVNVSGMSELNGRQFTVANQTTNTIELSGEDGTGHTAYSSGGIAMDATATDTTGFLSTLTADTDLDNAYVLFHYNPGNNVEAVKVTSFDAATDTITFAALEATNAVPDGKYAIWNYAPDIFAAGQWAFKEATEGDGSRTVWLWPLNASDLTNIEVSARTFGIDVADEDYWNYYDVVVEGVSGSSNRQATSFGTATNNGVVKTHHKWYRCTAKNSMNTKGWGGGFVGERINDFQVEGCTTSYLMSSQGIANALKHRTWTKDQGQRIFKPLSK